MKSFLKQIAMALLITSLAGVAAFAKTHKKEFTFDSATKVNGTVVKKGTYELKFDDASGELSLVKDYKVVARAATSTEKRETKARRFSVRLSGSGDDLQLVGVTFEGADHDIMISNLASR